MRRPLFLVGKLLLLSALLAANQAAAQQDAASPPPMPKLAAVVQAQGVDAAIQTLAGQTLQRELAARGYTVVDPAAVAAMMSMLQITDSSSDDDLTRLAKSLLATHVVHVRLIATEGSVHATVRANAAAPAAVAEREATVPAADLLPRIVTLTLESLTATAPAPPPAPPSPPALPPSSGSATTDGGTVEPEGSATALLARPAGVQTSAAAGDAPVEGVRAAPAEDPLGPDNFRFFGAAGLGMSALFDDGRAGPALDIELGIARHRWHVAALYRSLFGDGNAHLFGVRAEGGPRWGRFRLSFGGEVGVMRAKGADGEGRILALFSVRPVAGVIHFGVIQVHVNLFSLDVYGVPPTDNENGGGSSIFGMSMGVSTAFAL